VTTASINSILNFETYVLMTMKLRLKMLRKEAVLAAELSQHGFSIDDAERIHQQVSGALEEETTRFANMKQLLSIPDRDASVLRYNSVVWPGFEFNAIADGRGLLKSVAYSRKLSHSTSAKSPTELALWSVDLAEFTEHFGPMRKSRQWSVSDQLLPAYEEYEFPWEGESYGAGFSWGLFMFASKSWPED
jgi:hypothetical protein